MVLKPDPGLSEKEAAAEEIRLNHVREELNPEDLQEIIESNEELRKLQTTPDPQEALASIPLLKTK